MIGFLTGIVGIATTKEISTQTSFAFPSLLVKANVIGMTAEICYAFTLSLWMNILPDQFTDQPWHPIPAERMQKFLKLSIFVSNLPRRFFVSQHNYYVV